MIKDTPIFITGIPRSGASMVAKVINACGAFGGSMSNTKGNYENDRIRDTIVKSYLGMCGIDTEGQYPIHPVQSWIPTDLKLKIDKILTSQGYTNGNWMYKDARLALMYPVWNYAYPNAKWIIVRRRTGDIVQSCLKTSYMSAFKHERNRNAIGAYNEEAGWLWMVHQYEEQFARMILDGVNCHVIWPERMNRGDYHQLYDTLDWLGLPWKNDVIGIIDPLLTGTKQKKGGL